MDATRHQQQQQLQFLENGGHDIGKNLGNIEKGDLHDAATIATVNDIITVATTLQQINTNQHNGRNNINSYSTDSNINNNNNDHNISNKNTIDFNHEHIPITSSSSYGLNKSTINENPVNSVERNRQQQQQQEETTQIPPYNCNIAYTNENRCTSSHSNSNNSGDHAFDVNSSTINTTTATTYESKVRAAAAAPTTTTTLPPELLLTSTLTPSSTTLQNYTTSNTPTTPRTILATSTIPSNTNTFSSSPSSHSNNNNNQNHNDHDSAYDNDNENDNGNDSNNKQQKLSNKIVLLLRRSKPIGLVVINFVLAISIAISVCTTMGWDYTVPAIVFGVAAVVASSGLWYWLYIAAITAPRDIRALYRYIKLLSLVKRCQRKNVAICDMFHHYVAKHPQKPCLIYDGQEWTFRDVNEFSNRIANLFQQNGYKKGDVIGLYMENRPEFVATWLGLSKLGVIVPLINTNLRQASLTHSIQIAKCQALIYGESLSEAVAEIVDRFDSTPIVLYQYNDDNRTHVPNKSVKSLNELLEKSPKSDVVINSSSSPTDTHHDQLLYIYTSGTTGLPKAAVITHSRYIFIAAGIHYMANFKPDDIFYTPLPLYHTAGGVMSVGQALLFGSTVVIRKKFSASGYFTDCQKYKCTVAQYIGEMCRYILATPPNAADANHSVRIIFGNGLRPQIWPQFVNRFKIPNVAEFYGATEGNANIVNINNVVGAIGFVSRIFPSVYPISIIKADPSTGEPIRDPNGLCQLCKPHEPGVFVGKIMPGNPSRAFLGYVDKAASSKKVVKDVFKKGDAAFLSGDVLVSDELGNLYFKDRTGDTFRWKGENVSTSEVEAQVSNVAGYRDTVVYGVEIPHTEGRAGMAAILDVDQTIDLDALASGLKSVLPAYARPQFIRLLNKVDMTGTFKLKKLDLQKEGFNPTTIGDSLYYLSSAGKYSKLDKAIFEDILNGTVRF